MTDTLLTFVMRLNGHRCCPVAALGRPSQDGPAGRMAGLTFRANSGGLMWLEPRSRALAQATARPSDVLLREPWF